MRNKPTLQTTLLTKRAFHNQTKLPTRSQLIAELNDIYEQWEKDWKKLILDYEKSICTDYLGKLETFKI